MSNENEYAYCETDEEEVFFKLDELESNLEENIEKDLAELEILKQQDYMLGNPDELGKVVTNVIWEQFQNQIGVKSGEDFIKENNNQTLDLRNSAHIQTTENFKNGKIATHNHEIDYQKRYDDWQSSFQKDADGKIITHETRSGRREATLVKDARKPFDVNRPTGSVEKGTDIDHIISAGEIIRDPEANAHLSREEQVAFANSDINLQEIPKEWNRSKGDKPVEEWLDYPNSKGQTPTEIFDNLDNEEKNIRERNEASRTAYEREKQKGIERSIKTGRKSQRQEAFRIGKSAVRTVVMQLLAELVKEIIAKLVKWFKSSKKELRSLIDSIKSAIKSFVGDLKKKLLNAGSSVMTTIVSAIFGPIVRTIKKVWMLLKQGWSSLKQAVAFLRSPEAKSKPFDLVMMEVGKILIGALTAGGAIILSEVIEKGLSAVGLGIEIPLLGSLANILGIFFGAVVSGIIGAIALNIIDRAISKRQKLELQTQIAQKTNIALKEMAVVTWQKLGSAYEYVKNISERTVASLQKSEEREAESFRQLEDAYDEFEKMIQRRK